jgi:hypothetical protein
MVGEAGRQSEALLPGAVTRSALSIACLGSSVEPEKRRWARYQNPSELVGANAAPQLSRGSRAHKIRFKID